MNKPISPTTAHMLETRGMDDRVLVAKIQRQIFREQCLREAAEMRRLAEQSRSPVVALMLLRQATALERARGVKIQLTPRERHQLQCRINPEVDDLHTTICKLGGINTLIETDWSERLNHLAPPRVGLPKIVRRNGEGRSLDELAKVLCEYGYLLQHDVPALEEKLFKIERGELLYSLYVCGDVLNRQFERASEPEPHDPSASLVEQDLPAIGDLTSAEIPWRFIDGEWVYTQPLNTRDSRRRFRQIPPEF